MEKTLLELTYFETNREAVVGSVTDLQAIWKDICSSSTIGTNSQLLLASQLVELLSKRTFIVSRETEQTLSLLSDILFSQTRYKVNFLLTRCSCADSIARILVAMINQLCGGQDPEVHSMTKLHEVITPVLTRLCKSQQVDKCFIVYQEFSLRPLCPTLVEHLLHQDSLCMSVVIRALQSDSIANRISALQVSIIT